MFFELYLVDYNDDLIDVPVLIKNMQDKDGNKPNTDSSIGQESGWRLTHRFFLFDTKSGVEG
jgi:Meckelin (Transmembrane protein 67)